MPGMNGRDFFAELRNNSRTLKVPVVVISGIEDLEASTQSFGAKFYLKKPYSIKGLTALVKTHLQ